MGNKSGILLVYKERGLTSTKTLEFLKRARWIKKVGHFGALDPVATGLLLVGVNAGTKMNEYAKRFKKEYYAVVRFGILTDTMDIDGKIIKWYTPPFPGEKSIKNAVSKVAAMKEQKVPGYSAKKFKGKPLYKYTRSGKNVPDFTKPIEIYDMHILDIRWPEVKLYILCSAGTFIRRIAYDLGQQLDLDSVLFGLIRTKIGDFSYEKAKKPREITRSDPATLAQDGCFISMDEFVNDAVRIQVDRDTLKKVVSGKVSCLDKFTYGMKPGIVKLVAQGSDSLVLMNYRGPEKGFEIIRVISE